MKKQKKIKSPIDEMIIDLILEHYNIQSLTGQAESLTGDEFMELVEIAELQYYAKTIIETEVGLA